MADEEFILESDEEKECLIDVDNFNLKEYMFELFDRNKPLEAKDIFPYGFILLHALFIISAFIFRPYKDRYYYKPILDIIEE